RDQGEAVEFASRDYAEHGATGFVASVMTAPWDSMLHVAEALSEAAHALAEHTEVGARCLGIQYEGPFLNAKFRRVHRSEWLLPASVARAKQMIEAARGACVIVTMAPEVDGADEAARFLHDQGIVCSVGHTAAKYREGLLAIGLGFRSITHAFNAMPPLDHREPSILAAFIQEERTTIQLICDGFHVAPVMVDLLYRAIGDRLVLATDYTAPAGAGYRIEGGVVRAGDGTIAGSALHIDQAVRNLMTYTGIPFETAIIGATAAPARLLGLGHEIGTIAKGRRADLSIWDADYEVISTIVRGTPVHGATRLDGTREPQVT
ncbi:MAG TPA: amidohydrolase family protein, partial [Candidatus Baltobacteraceae bacterium]|nr:amidohydrolase family protein [Candidatus Baltobacteraceae bacterium]